MGLFGLVLSSAQAALMERGAVASVAWTPQVCFQRSPLR